MVQSCCVSRCESNYKIKYQKISMFRFPTDTDLRDAWLKNIPRKNFIPSQHSRICERHFAPSCIVKISTNHEQMKKKQLRCLRLVKNSVPTIFIEQSLNTDGWYRKKPVEKEKTVIKYENNSTQHPIFLRRDNSKRIDATSTQNSKKFKFEAINSFLNSITESGDACFISNENMKSKSFNIPPKRSIRKQPTKVKIANCSNPLSVSKNLAPSRDKKTFVSNPSILKIDYESISDSCTPEDLKKIKSDSINTLHKNSYKKKTSTEIVKFLCSESISQSSAPDNNKETALNELSNLKNENICAIDTCPTQEVFEKLKPSNLNTLHKISSKIEMRKLSSCTPIYQNLALGSIEVPMLTEHCTLKTKSDDISPALHCSTLKDVIKEHSLQQLFTNILPAYIPILPPGVSRTRPLKYHSCEACGDRFVLKSSLTFHLRRRSIHIVWPCLVCKARKVFYNRCALHKHILNHKVDGEEEPTIENAVVTPISKMSLRTRMPSRYLEEKEEETVTLFSNLLECSFQKTYDEYNFASMYSEEDQQLCSDTERYKCSICTDSFDTQEARQLHMTNGDSILSTKHKCNSCSLICPSLCSFKAHKRIHIQACPYVCPECGGTESDWTSFQNHINYKCFHNSRTMICFCPVCNEVFLKSSDFLLHLERHTENYIRCEICCKQCTSFSMFKRHMEKCHGECDSGKGKGDMFYKCGLCYMTFSDYVLMQEHRKSHAREGRCYKYNYNCVACKETLENKNSLLKHIQTTHQKVYKAIMMDDSSLKEEAVKPQEPCDRKFECLLCHSILYSQQGYDLHIKRHHANISQSCAYCYRTMKSFGSMVKHGREVHYKNGNTVCLLCNNTSFPPEELKAHLKTHTGRLAAHTFCPICNAPLTTRMMAQWHLQKEHHLGLESNQTTVSSMPCAVTCLICQLSFADNELLQIHQKMKHDMSEANITHIKSGACNAVKYVFAETPKIDECIICGFTSANKVIFKKHILTHKQDEYSFQCLACGACYTEKSSLLRHIDLTHSTKDA